MDLQQIKHIQDLWSSFRFEHLLVNVQHPIYLKRDSEPIVQVLKEFSL